MVLFLDRSLFLEALGQALRRQIRLEAHSNNHSRHLGAAFLVLLHHLVHQVNLHLALLAPQPLVQLAHLPLVPQVPQILG